MIKSGNYPALCSKMESKLGSPCEHLFAISTMRAHGETERFSAPSTYPVIHGRIQRRGGGASVRLYMILREKYSPWFECTHLFFNGF